MREAAAIGKLLRTPRVEDAMASIAASDRETLADQVALTRIPAPPFAEGRRAEELQRRLDALGVDGSELDAEGNVLAWRQGSEGGAALCVAAHLDTVFPPDVDTRVRVRGSLLSAPGISDNGRGLAGVLALLRVLTRTGIRTRSDLLLVGTVGEEGVGDLRGVKHLVEKRGDGIGAFVAVDGPGLDWIVRAGVGSRRYRVTFRGPGGHAWADFGAPNPAHALALAIRRLERSAKRLEGSGHRLAYNVGRIGGGSAINSIPDSAWMEVDLRAPAADTLEALDAGLHEALDRTLAKGGREAGPGRDLEPSVEPVGDRPGGVLPPEAPLLRRAEAATRALGVEPRAALASTDANVPMARGIPAIAVGAGGSAGGVHSTREWYANEDGPRGIQRLLLIVLAHAGLQGGPDGGEPPGTRGGEHPNPLRRFVP